MTDWKTWKVGAHLLMLGAVTLFMSYFASLLVAGLVVFAVEMISSYKEIETYMDAMIVVLMLVSGPHMMGYCYDRNRNFSKSTSRAHCSAATISRLRSVALLCACQDRDL